MLPFLKPKKSPGIVMAVTKPEGGVESDGMEGDENHGLMSAAEDLIKAIHSKDAAAVADAWRAGNDILEGSGSDVEGAE